MIYGLLAALSWGTAVLLAAVAARRIGAFRTVLIGEVAALTGFGLLYLLGHPSLRGAGQVAWLLVLAGMIGVVAYLACYRGLESGHVGLVSAISASYGGVIVILSVLLLGERLTPAAAGGVALTVTGVVLASGRASPGASQATRATGIAFGLTAAICYGVAGFLLGRYARDLGWLVTVIVARGGAMALLLALAATPVRRVMGSRPGPGVAWAVGAGLADAAGVAFFARGGQAGLVAVTAAASSAYPVIPLIGGLVLLHERLARWQAVGAALILAGLILLGASS